MFLLRNQFSLPSTFCHCFFPDLSSYCICAWSIFLVEKLLKHLQIPCCTWHVLKYVRLTNIQSAKHRKMSKMAICVEPRCKFNVNFTSDSHEHVKYSRIIINILFWVEDTQVSNNIVTIEECLSPQNVCVVCMPASAQNARAYACLN